MAEAKPRPKKKKGFLGIGPFGWAGIGAGGLLTLYLIRRQRAASAANAANTAAGLIGGSSIPAGGVGGGTTGLPSFSSFAGWEQAAIAAMTGHDYSASQALNDLSAWVNGGCVTAAGFTNIGNIIETLGLPPGFGTGLPPLTVCPAATPPPAAPPPPVVPPPITPPPTPTGGGTGAGNPGGSSVTYTVNPPVGKGASNGAVGSISQNGFIYNLYQTLTNQSEQEIANIIYAGADPATALNTFRAFNPQWSPGMTAYIPNNPGEPVYQYNQPSSRTGAQPYI